MTNKFVVGIVGLLYPAHSYNKNNVMGDFFLPVAASLSVILLAVLIFLPLDTSVSLTAFVYVVMAHLAKLILFSVLGLSPITLDKHEMADFTEPRKRSGLVWLVIWMLGLVMFDEFDMPVFGFVFMTIWVASNVVILFIGPKKEKKKKRFFLF